MSINNAGTERNHQKMSRTSVHECIKNLPRRMQFLNCFLTAMHFYLRVGKGETGYGVYFEGVKGVYTCTEDAAKERVK